MNTLIARFTNESPSFFKKIVAIGLTLGTVGAGIASAPVGMFTDKIQTIGGYFAAIGYMAALVAKTTVADASVLVKKEEPKA